MSEEEKWEIPKTPRGPEGTIEDQYNAEWHVDHGDTASVSCGRGSTSSAPPDRGPAASGPRGRGPAASGPRGRGVATAKPRDRDSASRGSQGKGAFRGDYEYMAQVYGLGDASTVFGFGKHRGRTYLQVLQAETGYFFWGLRQHNPSPDLLKFVTWVENNFIIDYESMSVATPDNQDSFQADTSGVYTGNRSPTSKEAKKQAEAERKRLLRIRRIETPKCEKCSEFEYVGSNAYYIRRTCLRCGAITKEPRPQSNRMDPETCPHLNVSAKGSTKLVRRTTCKDCGQILAEEPQISYKQRVAEAAASGGVVTSSIPASAVQARRSDDIILTPDQVSNATRLFAKMASKSVASSGTINETTLKTLLEDAIDLVVEEDSVASTTQACPKARSPPLPPPSQRAKGSADKPVCYMAKSKTRKTKPPHYRGDEAGSVLGSKPKSRPEGHATAHPVYIRSDGSGGRSGSAQRSRGRGPARRHDRGRTATTRATSTYTSYLLLSLSQPSSRWSSYGCTAYFTACSSGRTGAH